jgi:hypothetical protein
MTRTEAVSYHLPNHMHPLVHDGGMLYFDSQKGTWGMIEHAQVGQETLTGRRISAVLLEACGALDGLNLQWRELGQPEPYRKGIVEALCIRGLLAAGRGAGTRWRQVVPPKGLEFSAAGNIATARPLAPARRPQTRLEKQAERSLEEALTLVRGPLPALIDGITQARGANASPADMAQTLEMAQAVYQVSEWHAGKFACMEHSTATALLAAQEGMHVGLQFGASVDPINFHAWLTVHDEVVALPHEAPVKGRFYPVFEA